MPDIPLPKPQPPQPAKSTPSVTSPPTSGGMSGVPSPVPTAPPPPTPAPMPNRAIPGSSPTSAPASPPPPSPVGIPKPGGAPPTPPSSPANPAPTPVPKPATSGVPVPGSPAPAPVGNTQQPPTPASPKPATAGGPMDSIKKFLPFIIGGVVLLLIAVGAFAFFNSGSSSTPLPADSTTPQDSAQSGRQTVPGEQTQLTYWGLWESSDVLQEIFDEFEAENPGVEIVYQKQSHVDYRQRLQTAIASGNGPDLFRYHASWVPMLEEELAPLPSRVMSASEFQQTFYPVASEQLQVNGQIVGIPLMYDGIALYYNSKILATAGAEPPTTWTDLRTLASQLTIRTSNNISRAGLAIGNASNTEHFADIIALLMLQNGADPSDVTSNQASDALVFYTNFMNQDRVWSSQLPTSTVAFARGDVAMMFAPSWRAHEVQALNPDLEFGIVSVPTLGDSRLALASYWAEGVNVKSDNSDTAWDLLAYMSSADVMQRLYANQAETRSFGEIYSRVDLADSLANDPLVAPFLADAPHATGWYLNSYTHDKGLNDNLIQYYTDAVNALLDGDRIGEVVQTLQLGTDQILRQYNIQ